MVFLVRGKVRKGKGVFLIKRVWFKIYVGREAKPLPVIFFVFPKSGNLEGEERGSKL